MVKVPVSESSGGEGGNGFSERCRCHFVIEGWEDHSHEQKPYVDIMFASVASDVPSQAGKKRNERFSLVGKGVDKLLNLACAAGIYSIPQWEKDKKEGIDPDINCDAMVGMTLCAPVGMSPFDLSYWTKKLQECESHGDTEGADKARSKIEQNRGKSFPQVGGDKGFTFWAIGDPEADDIPLDPLGGIINVNGPLPTRHGTTRVRGQKNQSPAAPVANHAAKHPAPPAPVHSHQAAPSLADDLI